MIKVIKPPFSLKNQEITNKSIFLAGSIEMDNAEKWQDDVINDILLKTKELVTIYNPRRDNWDSSWKQEIEDPNFFQQVTWELQALEKSDMIFLYFDPSTKSPISLLELGLYAKSNKLIVCCPENFWRKGNVDITCNMYNVPLFDSLDLAKRYLIKRINEINLL